MAVSLLHFLLLVSPTSHWMLASGVNSWFFSRSKKEVRTGSTYQEVKEGEISGSSAGHFCVLLLKRFEGLYGLNKINKLSVKTWTQNLKINSFQKVQIKCSFYYLQSLWIDYFKENWIFQMAPHNCVKCTYQKILNSTCIYSTFTSINSSLEESVLNPLQLYRTFHSQEYNLFKYLGDFVPGWNPSVSGTW